LSKQIPHPRGLTELVTAGGRRRAVNETAVKLHGSSTGLTVLRVQRVEGTEDAELIALGVGEHGPRNRALTDIGAPSPSNRSTSSS
jgi:hypothetical protein